MFNVDTANVIGSVIAHECKSIHVKAALNGKYANFISSRLSKSSDETK